MKAWKLLGVIIGAVICTTVFIDASDTFSGKGGTLLAQLAGIENKVCPDGMVHMPAAQTFSCVDEYEASVGSECQITEPVNQFDSEMNIAKSSCLPAVDSALNPWRYVTREQASVLCTRAGKRLPSASEWYQFSLGTNAKSCNISTSGVVTGGIYNECISAAGVKNTVGNAWEWVSDDVIDGVYQARSLPATGYVAQIDSGGVATVTSEERSDNASGDDYFWSDNSGSYAMIRGGFYGSKSDAGTYTIHAHTLPTFTGTAVGFRCVK